MGLGPGLRGHEPRESNHADIGSRCPATFVYPVDPVFMDARLDRTPRGDGLVDEFIAILRGYVKSQYGP